MKLMLAALQPGSEYRIALLKPWPLMLGLVLFIAMGVTAWWYAGPIPVAASHPVRSEAIEAVYATGTVEPSVMLPISPRAPGYVRELLVDENASVKQGQILARLDDQDLTQSVAELAARERNAREHYGRTQRIVERGLAATSELDQARTNLEAARASLRRAQAQRDFMTLRAPADGRIMRRDGEIGQFLAVGQALFVLAGNGPLRVSAEVDEEDIPQVRVGMPVVLRAAALPTQILDGEVSEITPKGDPVARSYRVRIQLAQPGLLLAGMTVDANIVTAKRAHALLVPNSAVQENVVWQVIDGRLHRQPVTIGVRGEARTEILAGLSDDDLVAISPTTKLREGRRATPRLPASPTQRYAEAP